MAPSVSPNKSWEGAIGATLITIFVGLTVVPNFTPFNREDITGAGIAVGLALVIAVAAPLGDLVESAFKRDLGVKDMGSLLPGHGGLLDRIDGVLFAAPAALFFIRIVLG
jgi:phosphatidate cytidylyltransferase